MPYTKICEIHYSQSKDVSFRESFSDADFVRVTVMTSELTPKADILPYKPQLSNDKAKDMRAMLKFMPQSDQDYMTLLNNADATSENEGLPSVHGNPVDLKRATTRETKHPVKRQRVQDKPHEAEVPVNLVTAQAGTANSPSAPTFSTCSQSRRTLAVDTNPKHVTRQQQCKM